MTVDADHMETPKRRRPCAYLPDAGTAPLPDGFRFRRASLFGLLTHDKGCASTTAKRTWVRAV